MHIALQGHTEDAPDDPLTIVPSTPVEHRMVQGPLTKARCEDLQTFSWLAAASAQGFIEGPVGVLPGDDPPDRELTFAGSHFGLELAELTLQDLRQRLHRIRALGRSLAETLAKDPGLYAHLACRTVHVSDVSDEGLLASAVGPAVEKIAQALMVDRGFVGEGVDFSGGLPEQMPMNGIYSDLGSMIVQVYPGPEGEPGALIPVIAATQTRFRLSEARSLLWSLIGRKDRPGTDVVLVTTGLVDKAGYSCPADSWLFRALLEHGAGKPPCSLKHVQTVLVHDFPTGSFSAVYSSGAVFPNSAPGTSLGANA